MKKKSFFKNNENIIIYVVTAVFLIIAISVGISMYMKTETNQEISENTEKGSDENNLKSQEIEDVSSGIGKTIKEQENKPEEQEVVQPEETNIIVEQPNSTEKKDEKDSKITEPEETEKQQRLLHRRLRTVQAVLGDHRKGLITAYTYIKGMNAVWHTTGKPSNR